MKRWSKHQHLDWFWLRKILSALIYCSSNIPYFSQRAAKIHLLEGSWQPSSLCLATLAWSTLHKAHKTAFLVFQSRARLGSYSSHELDYARGVLNCSVLRSILVLQTIFCKVWVNINEMAGQRFFWDCFLPYVEELFHYLSRLFYWRKRKIFYLQSTWKIIQCYKLFRWLKSKWHNKMIAWINSIVISRIITIVTMLREIYIVHYTIRLRACLASLIS